MRPLTKEWVTKAEGDFSTALRESRARKNPNYDAVCFHAQQCAEKYLKAILQQNNIEFGKTHNLFVLLDKTVTLFPLLEGLRTALMALNVFAIDYRYPGEIADKEMAAKAMKLCIEVRNKLREALR